MEYRIIIAQTSMIIFEIHCLVYHMLYVMEKNSKSNTDVANALTRTSGNAGIKYEFIVATLCISQINAWTILQGLPFADQVKMVLRKNTCTIKRSFKHLELKNLKLLPSFRTPHRKQR